MIEPKIYRGIEYVRVSQLPEDQKLAIKNWLNMDVIIKIQTETSLMSDCVLFKDYQFWFNNIYTDAVMMEESVEVTAIAPKAKTVGNLAFD